MEEMERLVTAVGMSSKIEQETRSNRQGKVRASFYMNGTGPLS